MSKTLTLILISSFLVSVVTHGQTRKGISRKAQTEQATQSSTNRAVIIQLKDGSTLRANFIQADKNFVFVEISNEKHKFRTDEVSAIIFALNSTAVQQKSQNPAVINALQNLKQLSNAVEVGTNLLSYNSLLLNAKNE